jgi:hypothetical protein
MKSIKYAFMAFLTIAGCGQALAYPIKVTKLENTEGIVIYNIYDLHLPNDEYAKENIRVLQHLAEKGFTIFTEAGHRSDPIDNFLANILVNIGIVEEKRTIALAGNLSSPNIITTDARSTLIDDCFSFIELAAITDEPLYKLSEKTLNKLYQPLKDTLATYSQKKLVTDSLKKSYDALLKNINDILPKL